MAFEINYGASVSAGANAVRLSLESTVFSLNIPFGLAGAVQFRSIVVPVSYFDLSVYIFSGNDRLDFGFQGLGANDALSIFAVSDDEFIASTFHRGAGRGARCVVKCLSTGQSAQGCVTCTQGPLTVRICC